MRVNINGSIRFIDDRSKGDDYIMTEIVYSNDEICLCKSDNMYILFSIITGKVLTSSLQFYYAENF